MSSAQPSATTDLDATDLSSLFTYLIELCSTKSDSNEQQSIAQVIRPLFTKSLESSPSFYRFLNPLASTPKINKKNGTTKRTPAASNKKLKKKPSKSPQRKRKDSIPDGGSAAASSRPSSAKERQSESENISLENPAVPHMSQDEVILKLLKAIEFSQDEVATIVLCSLLRGYAVACKDPVGQRRLRRLVRLDAANYCLEQCVH
jgi:hypothetical protein